MYKSADEALDSMLLIEVSLSRRKPTLKRWTDYYMANTEKWYYIELLYL